MRKKLLIASALTLAVIGIGGSAVAWAAGSRQETPTTPPLTGNLAAMHGACISGNAKAMRAVIDNMTEEDWQAMAGQMAAHMGSGAGMMDSGDAGMMGGTQSGAGSMMSGAQGGAGGMMGSGGAGGMMGGAGMMGSSF